MSEQNGHHLSFHISSFSGWYAVCVCGWTFGWMHRLPWLLDTKRNRDEAHDLHLTHALKTRTR